MAGVVNIGLTFIAQEQVVMGQRGEVQAKLVVVAKRTTEISSGV
jgi:hypothetical protein